MAVDETDLTDPLEPAAHEDGFASIVDAHWSGVFRMLHSMTGNLHDAEELSQETFLRAWRGLDAFQPGSQMRSWLLRIAANACIDFQRKKNRNRLAPFPEDFRDGAKSPDHRLETAEQATLLRTAINELSEMARTVFHLRVEELLSFREIAEIVGGTEESARWHMHQARSKLLRRMRNTL